MAVSKSIIRNLLPFTGLAFLFNTLFLTAALCADEGDLLWRQNLTSGYISSSPALDGYGNIYIGASDGGVYALGPEGSVDWVFHSDGSVDDSPAIDQNGYIYFGFFRPFDLCA